MPAPEQILAEMADHPPIPPTPVEAIRARARRRVRRRRALGAAALVVAVLAVGAAVGAVSADDPADDVATGPGPDPTDAPTTTTEPPTTSVVPEEGLTLTPGEDLEDGTVVDVALDEPATGQLIVAQCAAEVRDVGPGDTADVLEWCPGFTYVEPGQPVTYTVRRALHTRSDTIDCAQPDRCLLAVRAGGVESGDDRFAVLRFRDDLPPLAEVEADVDGDEGTVGDGDRLLVTLTGVQTGEDVRIMQCIPDAYTDETGLPTDLCSSARSLERTVRDGPETQVGFTAFHDVMVDATVDQDYLARWTPCTPCTLLVRVGDRPGPVAEVPLEMEATDTPIRPQVTVTPGGPVRMGAAVSARATGLQPGAEVGVGWCPGARFDGGGDPACRGANGYQADVVVVDADGSLRLDGLVAPDPTRMLPGVDCSVAGECGVGLDSGDMFSAMALTPVTITP